MPRYRAFVAYRDDDGCDVAERQSFERLTEAIAWVNGGMANHPRAVGYVSDTLINLEGERVVYMRDNVYKDAVS